jgi:cobalt/nickel transport system ATP-binding protein
MTESTLNGKEIQIQDLSFSYPDGHQALQGVSLMVERGERLALVGPNGAGKSTLMLHLNGILRGQGRVRVVGLDVLNADGEALRRVRAAVGLVFQNPDDQLFSPTVFDDVAFGPLYMDLPPQAVHRRVERSLDWVDMTDYADRVSHHLSTGEKKRIAIATVLAMEPELLVLDEPTAGLDPRARRSLIELLGNLPQTLVVSTHDMRLVRDLCPRTVVLDGGQVMADGLTSEILSDESLLLAHGLERP